MEIVYKHYQKNYHQIIKAIIYWKPQFMQLLVNKFGLNEEFCMKKIEEFFKYKLSRNAVRHRIRRLLCSGWLKRELKNVEGSKQKIYFYSFGEDAKRYYIYWGGFDYNKRSPLMRKIPV